ncbi:MAG: hypothetical protein COX40_02715 [Candidatus Omnitrophica bacterium CG23_combo_of_CG06-09_8_20_14_all_40_11]|nr:MAG: hypothetical protein COX40_02715 [Candidatus Omnitrophica bacterium CG23_combo_of_CG06-09_8_20_14_all_40_11]
MDLYDYKEIMRQFYTYVADFISKMPQVLKDLAYEERFFANLNMSETERRNLVFDWYIFDYKSEALSKNLLQYFLEKAELSEDLKAIYEKFKDGIFSIFEIRALRMGKGMIARDLATTKEYGIKDTTLTRQISKGQCGFLRILPFKDYYILTGTGYFFPQEASRFIKLFFMDAEKHKKPFRLTPLTIYEIFFAQKKPESLPTIERFTLFCQEGGLKEDYINEIIQRIRKEALNKGDFQDIQKELIAKIKPYPGLDIKEITQAFMDVWNGFVSEQNGYVEKGPIETALINASMSYVQLKVNPKRFKSEKLASEKAERIMEEWLKTPRQELDGKTPEEVIIEERQKLRNPEKRVKFRINISALTPGKEVVQKANEAFARGRQLLVENKPKEAIEAYKEYISLHSQNHVVWHNMGIAYILSMDRINAERCFKKALEIKPDYELAKRNMEILNSASPEDIERMAKDYRVMMVNRDKEMEIPYE